MKALIPNFSYTVALWDGWYQFISAMNQVTPVGCAENCTEIYVLQLLFLNWCFLFKKNCCDQILFVSTYYFYFLPQFESPLSSFASNTVTNHFFCCMNLIWPVSCFYCSKVIRCCPFSGWLKLIHPCHSSDLILEFKKIIAATFLLFWSYFSKKL